jgi:hypothetical protein
MPDDAGGGDVQAQRARVDRLIPNPVTALDADDDSEAISRPGLVSPLRYGAQGGRAARAQSSVRRSGRRKTKPRLATPVPSKSEQLSLRNVIVTAPAIPIAPPYLRDPGKAYERNPYSDRYRG